MQKATIHRPVTITKLADVLDTKPYRITAELIRRAIFPAPSDNIEDAVAIEVAALIDVDLLIVDDDDGGTSKSGKVPVDPTLPPSSFISSKQSHHA